jgi:hypothetical protein
VARFETLDPEIRGVLGKKVSELGLRVEGSPVEAYVRQLYKELERRGLKRFRPVCYLTDQWGCPDQQPVLGIPFYLADPKLQKIEKAADALESDRQIMMYMRQRGRACLQLRLSAVHHAGMARPVRAVLPDLSRRIPPGAVQQALRAAHRRLVRTEASR